MLDFQRCPKPDQIELAKHAPVTVANQLTTLVTAFEHFQYWQRRMDYANTIGDIAVSTVATQLFHALGNDRMGYNPSDTRKHLLGLLAQSKLCQHLFSEELTELYDFATSNPTNGGIVLEQGVKGWKHQLLDPRIHVSGDFIDEFIGPAGDGPSTWYRADDLFVHRSMTARPSAEFDHIATQQGFSFDYASLQTLFPYLARL